MKKFSSQQLAVITNLIKTGIPVRVAAGFKEPTLLIPECECGGRYDMDTKECDCNEFCMCHRCFTSQQEGGKDE